MKRILLLLLCFVTLSINAQQTERIYLSGIDADNTVKWDFKVSDGMNAGKWKKIAVPSCWETQGFGEYTYGRYYKRGRKASKETGLYRYSFKIPADWQDRDIVLTFDGVMTDALVKVNGQQAGAVHQGSFTSFSYDVTNLIKTGKKNQLEVFVKKQSDDRSVNAAERRADWWLFGGIFRPVYIEALPKAHINNVEVDARADGTVNMRLHAVNTGNVKSIKIAVSGKTYGKIIHKDKIISFTKEIASGNLYSLPFGEGRGEVRNEFSLWSPSHPHLYTLSVSLLDGAGKTIHTISQKIGFRTIEFRPRDGFYLNGKKLLIKGINRHCFYPETGRTASIKRDIEDIKIIKGMNANAIRSHYPPDKHFLDLCDSLGVLYFCELPGWQNHYSTKVGTKILKEMMVDCANHPCIFAWGNGNEGGFNYDLDPLFYKYDIQKRHVVHPWALFDGVDAHHYPAYQTGVARFQNGYQVFMPTEFLHSQYDKGGGASLDDMWSHWKKNPLFAGGFIWAYADEGVVRKDRNDSIDTDDYNAPDGIVGPHREKEASWFTIRDVWSPIQISPLRIRPGWDGKIRISNESFDTNLSECKMKYDLTTSPSPKARGANMAQGLSSMKESSVAEGYVSLPSIVPGESGYITIPTDSLQHADILWLTALNANGDTINTWSFPLKYADEYFQTITSRYGDAPSPESLRERHGERVPVEASGEKNLSANGITAVFDPATGMLTHIYNGKREIPFNNGPVPVGMKANFKDMHHAKAGNDDLLVIHYTGAIDSIVWRMTPDGLLGMDAVILNDKKGHGYDGDFYDKEVRNLGFSFSYPEKECNGITWLGRGPYRVWRNRQRGQNFGLWHKAYNNTITGESPQPLVYPEFKGYHANVYWAKMESSAYPFTFYSETDGLYYRVFTPEKPYHGKLRTMPEFPKGDLSFLLEIPSIMSYKPVEQLGPQAQSSMIRINKGDEGLRIRLWFDFR